MTDRVRKSPQKPIPASEKPLTGIRWYADLRGEDGNAWVVMGVCRKAILQTLGKEEARQYGERARSGDYDNLLAVTREYIEIVDKSSGRMEWIDDD